MPPKKRGTRASKRKVEPEAEPEVETPEEEAEEKEEEEGSGDEEPMEEDDAAADNSEEEATEEDAPPEKKAKIDEEPQAEEEEKESEEDAEKRKLEELEKQMKLEEEKKAAAAAEAEKKAAEAEKRKLEAAEKKKRDEEERKREKEEAAKAELKRELDKYWKAVKDDPKDFTGWTYLLQFVDKRNILEEGREAYNAFLVRYPYCYGYWKKFGDFENRNGSPETVQQTFDRGLEAIPLSVDLWIHYLNYVKTASPHKDDITYIRDQYNRALKACGREWRSDKIWDQFIKFETEKENLIEVYQIFGRILRNSTQGLSGQFDKFREFIKNNHPKDLMDTSEFLALRKEVLATMKGDKVPGEGTAENEDAPADAEPVPGEEGTEGTGSPEETAALKENLVFSMKKTFKETQEKEQWRSKFEEKIKRPYFHVKPLERLQLQSWSEYLNEAMRKEKLGETDTAEVAILYERCLIACALYEEFWIKYVDWLKRKEGDDYSEEKIRGVFKRACVSHLPEKVDVQLRWSAFEETTSQLDNAAKILEGLETSHPDLVSVKLKRINFERRRGEDDRASDLYAACIKSVAEQKDNTLFADISIKYSRFLRLHMEDTEKAKTVINEALEKCPDVIKLYLQMLDILLHTLPLDIPEIIKFLDSTIAKESFKPSIRLVFSQRKVEILEDFGTNVQQLMDAHEKHGELSKALKEKMKEEEPAEQNNGETISTHQSNRDGKKTGPTPPQQNYPPVQNSGSYNAFHAQQHANYGNRYSNYPPNYQQGPPYGGAPGYGY